MDAEGIQTAIQDPANYVLVGAVSATIIGLAGVALGYVFGKKSGGEPISESTKSAIAEVDRMRAGNEVKLKEIEYAHAIEMRTMDGEETEKAHKRELESIAKDAEDTIAKEGRERARELEDRAYSNDKEARERTYRLELANKLSGLQPVIQSYEARRDEAVLKLPPELVKDREKYRQGLVDSLQETYSDADRLFNANEECGEISAEELRNIELLVDAKFPIPGLPELPREIIEIWNAIRAPLSNQDEENEEQEEQEE